MTTVTEQIESAIAEAGGSIHDALNVALAQCDLATALLKKEQERSTMLLCALESIRQLAWMHGPPPAPVKSIDNIAREMLQASGEIATSATERV